MKSDEEKTLTTGERNGDNTKLAPAVREIDSTNNTVAFEEIIEIIERARENTFRAANREFISMYWEIGAYIREFFKKSY